MNWQNATDEQINRAIAVKVMSRCESDSSRTAVSGECEICGELRPTHTAPIPNYCQDLNAAARAEEVAVAKVRHPGYALALYRAVGYEDEAVSEILALRANARTRCIAILTALEITEEGK